jgi:chromosome segregation ATPase|tara:strand:+ start:635 stop:1045 length:411 start_codon:yes stop_codon:yes gene_type:complete
MGGGIGMGEGSVMTDGGLSVISEGTVFTGKITHAERNLSKLNDKKRDDVDKLKYQIEELNEEMKELKQKYKGAVSRRDTLENQMKTIKTDFGMKIKMLLDKTENDDKLIHMLKQEIARLENLKGVKSQLKTDEAAS